MENVTTLDLDIAKNVFQVHGVDQQGKVIVRRQLRRRQVLKFLAKLFGMEACATAHHWARELRQFGHEVRLMPAGYVKPYVKRNSETGKRMIQLLIRPSNDAADAEAICEAVVRAPAHLTDQCDPRSPCRIRYCGRCRAQRC